MDQSRRPMVPWLQRESFGGQKYKELVNKLKSSNELFVDQLYKPQEAFSLLRSNEETVGQETFNFNDLEWRRPYEINCSPRFRADNARFEQQVSQGSLNNCWLLAAINWLARNETYLDIIVPKDQQLCGPNYWGIINFNFYIGGKLLNVIIDDRLPCKPDGRLVFAKSTGVVNAHYWAPLLEKAISKLFGNYLALEYGDPSEAYILFTNGLTNTYPIETFVRSIGESKLFRLINKLTSNHDNMLTMASYKAPIASTITGNHIYLIEFNLANNHQSECNLLTLVDPMKPENLVYIDSTQIVLGSMNALIIGSIHPGMDARNFKLNIIDNCFHLNNDCHGARIKTFPIDHEMGSTYSYYLEIPPLPYTVPTSSRLARWLQLASLDDEITGNANITISLSQKNNRYMKGGNQFHSIGLDICTAKMNTTSGKVSYVRKFIDYGPSSRTPQLSHSLLLPPGGYLIKPRSHNVGRGATELILRIWINGTKFERYTVSPNWLITNWVKFLGYEYCDDV